MERDLRPLPGDDDPLDAALGELPDLAELEQRFALLDARAARRASMSEDDPFADIEAALREQRGSSRDVIDGQPSGPDDGDDVVARDDEADDGDDPSELSPEDQLAEEIELKCQEALDVLEDEDDVERARELALDALRMDDEHPFPLFVLGLVAEREGDLDGASDMAELALRTAQTNPDAIGLRAHVHVRRHEFADAESLLRFGIAHNPDEATLHEALARVTLAQGDAQSALVAAQSALRLDPSNVGAIAVRAAVYEASADRSSVLAVLRQGVQLHPDDPYAMVELAAAEMEHGHHERARMLLARAHRIAPHDSEIADLRGLVEHVRDRRTLQPVPGLVRWIREFPGGMPGFLVGFLIAALPLHALAVAQPAYRWPAVATLTLWGLVALYAWVAPSVLSRHLDRRAAQLTAQRMDDLLRDPLGSPPSTDQVCDTAALLVQACDYRAASSLLARFVERVDPDGTDPTAERFRAVARRLRRWPVRAARLALFVPGTSRVLTAGAATCAIGAPLLAAYAGTPVAVWYLVSLALLALGALPALLHARVREQIEDALTAARLGAGHTERD